MNASPKKYFYMKKNQSSSLNNRNTEYNQSFSYKLLLIRSLWSIEYTAFYVFTHVFYRYLNKDY